MIGQTISHYQILEKLGQGGMGVVYKAQDTKLNRTVALKFLPQDLTCDQEAIDRFINEAQTASSLDHANICTIHEINETEEDQLYIVMAYYAGETLQKKVASGQLSVNSVIDIVTQTAHGLERAHEADITHRDIKPSNLIITPRGEVKIIDFGLAKLAGQSRLTKSGSTPGTVAYMSPEQVQGTPVDQRTDIWSLGVVLYEILTGRLPFHGDNEAAIIYSIVNETLEPVQNYRLVLSPEFLHVFKRTLEKNPADRYQSVSDMLIDLHRLKSESTKETPSGLPRSALVEKKFSKAPATVRAPRPFRKKMWMSLGAVAVLVIIATVLLLLPKRRPELNPNMTFRILSIPFTMMGYPGLSQDGNWVAFPAADANGKWDVYFMNISGGEPRRITSDSSFVIGSADISPDGDQIVYNSGEFKTGKHKIYIVSSLGGLSKKIVDDGWSPMWCPNGQRIGYIRDQTTSSGKLEFWSAKPNENNNRLEFVDSVGIREPFSSFSWSPDGNSVAWTRKFPEGYHEIIVRELSTGQERQVTFEQKKIEYVRWTSHNEIIFSSNKSGTFNLWMVPVTGGQAVQITKGSGPDLGVSISRDGKKMLCFQFEIIGYLWIANSKSSEAHQITFDDRKINHPSFSPDGKHLVFSMIDPGLSSGDPGVSSASHIYIMNRDGSNRQQLTFGNEYTYAPRWSPDGQWIAYTSQPIAEPSDSAHVYLIAVSNPERPRRLGTGWEVWWVNPNNLVAFNYTTLSSRLFSFERGQSQRFYEDSTRAYPICEEKYVLFRDYHVGRYGWWTVPVVGLDAPSTGPPKKILTTIYLPELAPNAKSLFYVKHAGEIWRISLPDGNEQRFLGKLPDQILDFDVSYDGEEIVYVETRLKGKLVMIENLFK